MSSSSSSTSSLVIDDTFVTINERSFGFVVENELLLKNLSRADVNSVLECQAFTTTSAGITLTSPSSNNPDGTSIPTGSGTSSNVTSPISHSSQASPAAASSSSATTITNPSFWTSSSLSPSSSAAVTSASVTLDINCKYFNFLSNSV